MTKAKGKKNLHTEPSQAKSKFEPKRNDMQKAKDRKLISELSLRGWTCREMEQHPELNHISYKQINDDQQIIRKEWAAETNIEIDEFKAQQLKRLDDMYSELRDAWDGSRMVLRTAVNKLPVEVQEQVDKFSEALFKIGNYNYMKTAIDAVKEQNKILGAHAPIKTDNKNTEVTISFKDS